MTLLACLLLKTKTTFVFLLCLNIFFHLCARSFLISILSAPLFISPKYTDENVLCTFLVVILLLLSFDCVCFVCVSRAEQRGAAGLQQRQQSEQQCQSAQCPVPPAPHGAQGGQLGCLLRVAAAGPRWSSLLLGTNQPLPVVVQQILIEDGL